MAEVSPWVVESLKATLRIAQLGSNDDTNPTWDEFEQALAVVNATGAQLAWAESEIALLRSQVSRVADRAWAVLDWLAENNPAAISRSELAMPP